MNFPFPESFLALWNMQLDPPTQILGSFCTCVRACVNWVWEWEKIIEAVLQAYTCIERMFKVEGHAEAYFS